MPKRMTPSDLLREYKSQTKKFRDHTDLQNFCKIQVEKGKQQDASIFLLSTFSGSPTCSAGAWVKELDSCLQLHHIYGGEAIRVVALHFRGKAHAWWIFQSCSLKNANTFSYERFIKTLIESFGEKLLETHEQGKLEKTKPLHVMEETPFQKTIEGADILHYTFQEARPPVHILEQEGMGISFSQEDLVAVL